MLDESSDRLKLKPREPFVRSVEFWLGVAITFAVLAPVMELAV